MSDTVILQRKEERPAETHNANVLSEQDESNFPSMTKLQAQFEEASKLVDDIILKKYLYKLSDLEIIPLSDDLKKISDIRIFKITEMVYQKDEYSTYKFASVFNSVQNLNCGVFIIVDSDGEKTDFYMGVRSLDNKRTTKSLKDTLRNALIGQFPGVKTVDLRDPQAETFLNNIPGKNISSVSCVANNKDEDFKDNETFIQGLEKLALAMQGQKYTAIILAKSTSAGQLDEIRKAYETVYTQLSPFANMQLSYGTNTALSISDALSHGTTIGTSYAKNTGTTKGTSYSKGTSESESVSKANTLGTLVKTVGSVGLGALSVVAAPLTGGASLVAAGAIVAGQIALGAYTPSIKTKGHSISENYSESKTHNEGETYGENQNKSESETHTQGVTSGKNQNMQLTMHNKTLLNTLDRIDLQLKRLDECESLGMWECAAYFLSDSQETAEMAAGTYKALMKGAKSGVETSAINYWGRQDKDKLPILREYITNFIHPVFAYTTDQWNLPVTASSLLSSNEVAIQMGLPRKSVCGFPVIEHTDFGKEVVSYSNKIRNNGLRLGNIFTMGTENDTSVKLDINSLAMHTFVTGSTGSGKSNTVYEILNQLHNIYGIPFLVVEPAKGEYKNMFGQLAGISVYGTNPKKNTLLKINPFSFPNDVHVLEHLDRLVELFNVCWPMYAAMPAVLKSAVEKSYEDCGWNLVESKNIYGDDLYPNFSDVSRNVKSIIDSSEYDTDNKGAYKGSLLTRLNSLTNGINGLIFTNKEIPLNKLFDENVILDLSRVGSSETKSLIMGMIVLKLQEYRMTSGKMNAPLKHITVLEEAHNLLKRTSTEQNSESANLLGKSVEMISNAIAEMRTYGEGFIIADQSPSLLDMSVIRNTNTKIIMRIPDITDRELVGSAANLNESQIDELAKLPCGVAAVYQNEWIQPVLCKIEKFDAPNKPYAYQPPDSPCSDFKSNDMISIADLLSNGTKMGREAILKDILPKLSRNGINASVQVAIAKQLENPPKEPRMTKLAPIMSALFPKVRSAVIEAYKDNLNTIEWTNRAEEALFKDLHMELNNKTRRDIIQSIITDYVYIELGRQNDLQKWAENGGLR